MNRKEFIEGIKNLELSYNQKFTEEKLNYWYEKLKDMDANKYLKNIDNITKTFNFMPNIAQIRSETISKQYNNFQQRDYSGIDFDKLFFEQQINHIPTV